MSTFTAATRTFSSFSGLESIGASTSSILFEATRTNLGSLNDALESVFRQVAIKGSVAAPYVIWRDAFSPSAVDLRSFISISDEPICELTEDDLVLPEYCSRALESFQLYKELELNWDGDGALAPDISRIAAAEYYLRILGSNVRDLPEASPMLDQDGIPGIFWDTGECYLSVSFYDADSLTYVFRNRNTGESSIETISLSSAPAISNLLSYTEQL